MDPMPSIIIPDETQESSRVIMETKVIKNLISSYYRIVKINISDLVPKAIMAFLVNDIKNKAHMALVEKVYLKTDLESLLVEDP